MRSGKIDAPMYYIIMLPAARRFAPQHAAAATFAPAGLEGSYRAANASGRPPGRAKRLRGVARFVRWLVVGLASSAELAPIWRCCTAIADPAYLHEPQAGRADPRRAHRHDGRAGSPLDRCRAPTPHRVSSRHSATAQRDAAENAWLV
jgi:hypothetical protein